MGTAANEGKTLVSCVKRDRRLICFLFCERKLENEKRERVLFYDDPLGKDRLLVP